MISDQIGDLLTRIRNATMVEHPKCSVDYSNLKQEMLQILKTEGYIVDFQKIVVDSKKSKLEICLKYKNHFSIIQGIKRVSKPGLRIYVKKNKMPIVLEGIGVAIVSTSSGLMTAKQARNQNLGGEILAHVW